MALTKAEVIAIVGRGLQKLAVAYEDESITKEELFDLAKDIVLDFLAEYSD